MSGRRIERVSWVLSVLLGSCICMCEITPIALAADVDADRLRNADREPENWFAGGRDQTGSYYSPLRMINASTVKNLGFAWQYDLGTYRGQEATPIVVDGTLYTAGTWGHVYALDATTGRQKWRFIPTLDPRYARNPCCDLVNRGIALWKGIVFVASVDGHLHALNASTGQVVWEVDTIVDHSLPYSSTGAPQIAGNLVIIGNGGGDMGRVGVRGYASAYDLKTGVLQWRFYTVPPAPGKPYENPELIHADTTWDASRQPQFNGGGTVWDGLAYDPALDLVFMGTGNPSPYDLRQLGPSTLDSLYTSSIIAVHRATGRLAWSYQTTPHDIWDFDAAQKFILTDLIICGKPHSVLMQASKNGFFYVLDRKTGALLSAHNYTYVNWASRIDTTTGRPVLNKDADWRVSPKAVYPSAGGGHSWNPMSYSPLTHLVYIPVIDAANVWVDLLHNGGSLNYIDSSFTVGSLAADAGYDRTGMASLFGPLPDISGLVARRRGKPVREVLRAWDPVIGKTVWEAETSHGTRGFDGGVLSTAGNLVFQGRGDGLLYVYAADTGEMLKALNTGSHILAAPMTYAVEGVQYIAVQVGYGGAAIMGAPIPPNSAARRYQNVNRVIAFRLGGGAVPKPPMRDDGLFPQPPPRNASSEALHRGEISFTQECSRCHVLGPSSVPDLRRMNAGLHSAFDDIVLRGALSAAGMERFDDILSIEAVHDIHAYLIEQSWLAYEAQQKASRSEGKQPLSPEPH